MRLWIDNSSVEDSLIEDGDLAINAEDFYFFKRAEIANELGYHFEFASTAGTSFELYLTHQEFSRFIKQIVSKLVEYNEQSDLNN